MLQLTMIGDMRSLAQQDERVVAVLMFGSFVIGEGDAFSDIEFAVFLRDDVFSAFPRLAWLETLSPVDAWFPDDFGHHTALFENGVRGEFHFFPASDVAVVEGWKGYAWFPSLEAAVLLDRTGELSSHASVLVGGPPARGGAFEVEGLALNLLNLMLFGANLLSRGEFARAWALLSKAHEPLLKLARLSEGATEHWPTPSRALEKELSKAAGARYMNCTAGAQPAALRGAYQASWIWARELVEQVGGPLGVALPPRIVQYVDQRLL